MKTVRFLVVGLILASFNACASTSTLKPRNYEQVRLQDEANEFYNAWRDKNSEKIWQLSSPFFKEANDSKEEWIKYSDRFLRSMDFLDYSNLKVIYLERKLAVTQADISLTLKKEGNFSTCERIIWLRFPEGWRFEEPSHSCDYMPDADRIKTLTQKIP